MQFLFSVFALINIFYYFCMVVFALAFASTAELEFPSSANKSNVFRLFLFP